MSPVAAAQIQAGQTRATPTGGELAGNALDS